MVIVFSALSVIVALMLGIRPLVGVHPAGPEDAATRSRGSRQATSTQHVEVPNRDEFGKLASDLNSTSARLATLFDDQRALGRATERDQCLARARQRGEVAVPGECQP